MKGLDAIEEIKKKFNLLLENNNKLTELNSSLKEELSNLNQQSKAKDNELNELKDKYKILKMSKKLDGDESETSKELKLKINEMVKEIDKCIALLNK
ncbi:MAG: hypothetical protein CL853_00805 [Crocinitomicaceae bacterium]|nr:hypothetical protein [Crocinitomicaceae bacterium]